MARDWFDYVDKLALPLVLAFGSILFTAQKDAAERRRADAQQVESRERVAFDRDSGYVRLLASANERERDLGLKIIDALSREHKFSADLIPVVSAIAAGRPSDPATQTAAHILVANPAALPVSPGRTVPARTPATVAVYIQIAREDQRPGARILQDKLGTMGFATPGIELVPNGTNNTYVRFFSRPNATVAATVRDVMDGAGYGGTAVQDFVNPARPLSAIEVWIGSKTAGAS